MSEVYTDPPRSRNEEILNSMIEGAGYTDPPRSRIEDLLLELKETVEQGGDVEIISDNEPYSIRKSKAYGGVYDKIVGGTIVWNQLVNTTDTSVTVPNGHKYALYKNSEWSAGISDGTSLTVSGGNGDMCFDLTRMFGNSVSNYIYQLEQETAGSGITWIKRYGFLTKSHYEYNSGELLSVKVSGKRVVGKNLLNTLGRDADNGFVVSKLLNDDGSLGDSWFNVSEYCKIPENTRFTVSGIETGGFASICFYDKNKQFISGIRYGQRESFTDATPEGTVYFRASMEYDTLQVELGSTETSQEYYCECIYPVSDIELRGRLFVRNGALYYSGDVYEGSGAVLRYSEVRAYESGDENYPRRITDGTNTVVINDTCSLETGEPFAFPQFLVGSGTEEFIDTREVPMPAGHDSEYYKLPEWMDNRFFRDIIVKALLGGNGNMVDDYVPINGSVLELNGGSMG